MSWEAWLDILRCPACAANEGVDPGQLDLVAARWFVCRDCHRKYPILRGIPSLLIEQGDKYRDTPVEALDDLAPDALGG